ncbi:response regulator [Haloimpatiens sp. FM7315]|uniref:response regulator n=1 Tax=Haloimpatiens sp. FM7315 TaxID=3298609 RepID=UPI0035A2D307
MKKVIIVDDTKNIRNLLTTCLQIEGYETIEAKNGEEALSIIENEEIDLAFIDIKMPEISGTELLKRIRARGKEFTVVIMTAFPTIKNAVDCTKLGAVAYLQKPFTAERIKNLLDEIDEEIIDDDNLSIYIKNAKKYMEDNNMGEALKILKRALAVEPKFAEAYYLISKIYGTIGDEGEAKRFYEVSKLFGYGKGGKL